MNNFWSWFNEIKGQLKHRAETFAKIFEYLDTIDAPIRILETGTAKVDLDWQHDGGSTFLFDRYVQARGGRVYSIDIDEETQLRCLPKVSKRVFLYASDSVSWLKGVDLLPFHLVYLDSFDYGADNGMESATHHLNELLASIKFMTEKTLVVVDDSPMVTDGLPWAGMKVLGKGQFVADYAQGVGADMMISGYQAGWTNMLRKKLDLEDLVNRARWHRENGRSRSADSLYRLILTNTTPPTTGIARIAHGEACAYYADEAVNKKRFATAADWYRSALAADPLATDYRCDLVMRALIPMYYMKEAKLEAERATRIAPDYPRVWHVLGGVEFEEGNTEAAKAAYDRQLELAPHDLDAILDRAALAIDIQEYDYGQELAARVIGTDREGDGWHCRAIIAYRQGGHEEAIQLYDIAIARGCNDVPVTRWNKSLALHSLGRYREGWIDHEQRKFQKKDSALAMPARRFILPMWNHEPPPAQIHVHPEAGMGDNICLSRYLNLLTDQGYDVSFEVHDDLYDLMKLSFPKVNVVHKAPDYPAALGIPLFDYHIPTGSLPAVFQTEVDTVPWSGPFLRADPEKVEHYRKLVPPGSVGIVWSSGIRPGAWITTYGQMKSMKLADMEPLMKLGRTLVSLQVGPERAELANYPNVLDVLPAKPTWADTAALIECLRGVVTVDTGVSHLAGGMGMPVMLTMHCHGSWHYLADRPGTFWQTRSPWYPATALYRQSRSFHWDDVIQRISADIEADHWLTPAKLENAA